MRENLKDTVSLFSSDILSRIAQYLPASEPSESAKFISGRLLEEVVEFHLATGGSPTSALMHCSDAITNEAFKSKQLIGSGGTNQNSYPSVMNFDYDNKEVQVESADIFIMTLLNFMHNNVDFEILLDQVVKKLDKLDKAREEGRLIQTSNGTFYINKNKD
jgi:hypothetical protein